MSTPAPSSRTVTRVTRRNTLDGAARPTTSAHRRKPRARSAAADKLGEIPGEKRPLQLPLLLVLPAAAPPLKARDPIGPSPAMQDRLGQLDQRMSTNEVLRVLGINRSTLYRWRKKRKFPPKHDSGGWRRSDVEKWFADNPGEAQ